MLIRTPVSMAHGRVRARLASGRHNTLPSLVSPLALASLGSPRASALISRLALASLILSVLSRGCGLPILSGLSVRSALLRVGWILSTLPWRIIV